MKAGTYVVEGDRLVHVFPDPMEQLDTCPPVQWVCFQCGDPSSLTGWPKPCPRCGTHAVVSVQDRERAREREGS